MAPTTTPIAYDIAQAATQLRTTTIAVKRLVSRGTLKATTLGKSGPALITPDELARYVAAGAPDFDAPQIAGRWFANELQNLADVFYRELADRCTAQVPDDDALARLVSENPKLTEIPLKVTPEVSSFLAAPVPASAGATPFATWAELFVAHRLRDAALQIAGAVKSPIPLSTSNTVRPIERLYSADYAAIVDRAAADTLARKAANLSRFVMPAGNGLAPRTLVNFVLPMGAVATPAVMAKARQSAF